MQATSEILKKARRVVVKVGSSILVGKQDHVSRARLSAIGAAIASVRRRKIQTILVSSGAISSGMRYLGFHQKPKQMSGLQACAAIGQPLLMQLYHEAFSRSKLQVAQVLLTRDDFANRRRLLNAKHTLHALLTHGVVPIINENDTVVVDEIRVGDNDNLSSLVATLVEADLLILLTDQDGFFTADPRRDTRATHIPVVRPSDRHLFAHARDTSTATSVGGMKTKLEAAWKAASAGIPTIIANGNHISTLQRIFRGEDVGTLFLAGRK